MTSQPRYKATEKLHIFKYNHVGDTFVHMNDLSHSTQNGNSHTAVTKRANFSINRKWNMGTLTVSFVPEK